MSKLKGFQDIEIQLIFTFPDNNFVKQEEDEISYCQKQNEDTMHGK